MQRKGFLKANIFLVAGTALGLLGSLPVKASLIVTVQSVTAAAGDINDAFDVTLQNTGGDVTIGGFTFNVSTTDTNISFTDATTATTLAAYIFAGSSAFGPDLTGANSGQTFALGPSDLSTILAGVTVAGGTTVGLGHVFFSVASGAAPGPFAVTLGATPAVTSLSDPGGNNIPIDTLTNGTITITSTPEPASLLLSASVVLIGLGLRRRSA